MEFSRALGLTKKELEQSLSTTPTTDTSVDQLFATAKGMGIDTEGKTRQQITKEIANQSSERTRA